ncbi:hypothetical protein [Candidatus Methanoperedens nitratireducens]|uniref:Uncharacterized protein n=1 Tax=Candidatus Methanoperedens nitratireducens TaxID=1392998 RepID=A0A284VTE8_9EURY|nr:hypothetical protein [Candidatus Methanoperedens nitroreducens]SNQ62468.1 hypothetical protein MNV_740019 [Candidatus Methanoperedens nitroreducens]
MNKETLILVLLTVVISGCIEPGADYLAGGNKDITPEGHSVPAAGTNTSAGAGDNGTSLVSEKTGETLHDTGNSSSFQLSGKTNGTLPQAPVEANKSELLIDRIALDLSSYYEKKWNSLYQADELDCSRMSVYLWDYIRTNYHVAPKIIVSYQRQHAWLALKVSDVGNSSDYMRWNIRGTDYYYLEATIPSLVADDNRKFIINDQSYTSAEFYNAAIYIFDTPQDANDFHAEGSWSGGWNQEFRLKKGDMDKITRLIQ